MVNSLFFDKPAVDFFSAIPMGNGHIGALVFGGSDIDRIQLNDISLWSGYKADLTNPEAGEGLKQYRELFFQGKYLEAQNLAAEKLCYRGEPIRKAADSFFGSYQMLGELTFFFDESGPCYNREYSRKLDMDSGICTTRYRLHCERPNFYQREYFVSFPDDVFCCRMSADLPEKLNVIIRLQREKEAVTEYLPNGTILLHGCVNGGLRFAAGVAVIPEGGQMEVTPNSIRINNADSIRVLLSSATSFTSSSPEEFAQAALAKAARKSYEELRRCHIADFSGLYERMKIRIGEEPSGPVSFQSLFEDLAAGKSPGRFASIFARYNRYLLISCSRPGNLPANIQGIWAPEYRPPWASDYHLNANTQIVYWSAEAANLPECHQPLFDWIHDLARSGKRTAEKHFGVRGWTTSWTSNIWGYTEPGKNLQWGMFPEAGAWLALHIRDHFEFTGDIEFLRREFPTVKSACEFCIDMLCRDPKSGKLLFGPTVPPEHGFLLENGERVFLAMGTATGQEIVYALLKFAVHSAKLLGGNESFLQETEKALADLALPAVDAEGMIGKWIYPFRGDGQRHFRHIFGVYPGNRLLPVLMPEWAEPIRQTCLDHEVNGGECEMEGRAKGSWSGVWLLHIWARLFNGEKCHELLNKFLLKTVRENLFAVNSRVFQADGNFGMLSGILEMLVQSYYENGIYLLPALPEEWKSSGSISGLRARGGFEISFDWTQGKVENLRILSLHGGPCRIFANGKKYEIETEPEKEYKIEL